MKRFWTCWVEGTDGGYGTQHQTRQIANDEAERLAMKCAGKRVFVLECVGSVSVNRPQWEVLEHDELPF